MQSVSDKHFRSEVARGNIPVNGSIRKRRAINRGKRREERRRLREERKRLREERKRLREGRGCRRKNGGKGCSNEGRGNRKYRKAAQMREMSYDCGNEMTAYTIATECGRNTKHISRHGTSENTYRKYNVKIFDAEGIIVEAINSWFHEIDTGYMEHGEGQRNLYHSYLNIPNFAKIVWGTHEKVGCAVVKCSNYVKVVCLYGPNSSFGEGNQIYRLRRRRPTPPPTPPPTVRISPPTQPTPPPTPPPTVRTPKPPPPPPPPPPPTPSPKPHPCGPHKRPHHGRPHKPWGPCSSNRRPHPGPPQRQPSPCIDCHRLRKQIIIPKT
ncbi:hypothetical protein RB195_004454 [Necator americanus]|uniref:SCP domain-containing protein n=1 Tax=Necator americanus TaxID=51031 RepID=A0ABR1BM45_NECAM